MFHSPCLFPTCRFPFEKAAVGYWCTDTVFGGMPRVILEAANNALPENLKKRLNEMTTRSA